MITAIDVETRGLDATKFVMACLMKEGQNKTEFYKDKNKLWKRLKELADKENKRKKRLTVYSHNAAYDFYSYANLRERGLTIRNDRPLIAALQQEEQDKISFLDTKGIYGRDTTLAELGDIINLPKKEMPEYFKTGQQITDFEIELAKPYNKRDTEIVLKAVLDMKQRIKKEGITIRRLYTIHQIAISWLIQRLQELPKKETEGFFQNHNWGRTWKTYRKEEVHAAFRGPRVEAFKTGIIKRATYIDCNSLYPFAATKIRQPDLRSERKIWKPLEKTTTTELLNIIGLSRAMIRNESNNLGLLPIRTGTGNFYPRKGQTLIGTWTHMELKEALKEGYKLIDIEWSVIYNKETKNIFKDLFEETYKKRKEAKTRYDKKFYKLLMNSCLGKLAQNKPRWEIIVDSIEEAQKYIENNYKIVKGLELDMMYKRAEKEIKTKRYYTPIIPTLTNAWARIYMYHIFKQIGPRKILYTDTDSAMITGKIPKNIPLGNEMGQFKIENKEEKAIIYGRKTYNIGTKMTIGGMRKYGITQKDFEEGYIESPEMITIKTSKDIKEVGKFKTRKRNLIKQEKNYKELMKTYKESEIMADIDIKDLRFFMKHIVSQKPQTTKTFKKKKNKRR